MRSLRSTGRMVRTPSAHDYGASGRASAACRKSEADVREDCRVRLVVLGCCGGYPGPDQACSGYLVAEGNSRLWVDAGSGTLARLLRYCSLADLDSVWLTHLHPDHWTDIPLAVHALALGAAERRTPLPIYGPSRWADAVGEPVRWRLDDPDPVFESHELRDGTVIELHELAVEAAAVEHGLDTYALRISGAGATLAYSADSAPCEALVQVARDADLFLCEAGTTAHSSPLHLNAGQAGEIATAAGVRRLVLTHLRPGDAPEQAKRLAGRTYAGDIEVASEGAEFEIAATTRTSRDSG
jgi:ribonuclease BN (tRNA processing enzyme)